MTAVLLPFVDSTLLPGKQLGTDPDGQLKVLAADASGCWRPIALLTGQMRAQEGGVCFEPGPWKQRGSPADAVATVLYLAPHHLQKAKAMLRGRLEGVEVLVADDGVVVVERNALSRERVELASIWLNLAGHVLGLAGLAQPSC